MTPLFEDVYQHSFVVSNIERSLKFWRDIIGFKVERVLDLDPATMREMTQIPELERCKVALLWMGPHNLELLEYYPQTLRRTATRDQLGSSHIAFSVSNMQEVYETLKAKGVKIVHPPIAYGMYFEDPDGITVELIHKRKEMPEASKRG